MTTMGLDYQKYIETKRSNLAREAETNRSNLANEFETNRANVARETETNRTNLVNEDIKRGTLDEQIRANKANEGIKRDSLEETARHNSVTEDIQSAQNVIKQMEVGVKSAELGEKHRANLAKEAEIHRANVALETFKSIAALPEGSKQIAALGSYLKEYGGDISEANRKRIQKHLNGATITGGLAAVTNSMIKDMQSKFGQIGSALLKAAAKKF